MSIAYPIGGTPHDGKEPSLPTPACDRPAIISSPTFVKAGKGGGKICQWPNGRTFGPIAGEALRGALARGAKIIGEVPREEFSKPTGESGTPRAGLLLL